MKKILALLSIMLLSLVLFVGCGSNSAEQPEGEQTEQVEQTDADQAEVENEVQDELENEVQTELQPEELK